MIDKLYLRFKSPPEPTENVTPGRPLIDLRYSNSYEFQWPSRITGELCRAVLKVAPRVSTPFYTHIEVNPSRVPGLTDIFHLITGLSLTPSDGEITRIDHCADLDDPLVEVLRGIHFARKRTQRNYSSGLPTGAYIGKRPEQLLVYQKSIQNTDPRTRVELQQFADKCSVKTVADLASLIHQSPFVGIRHFKLKSAEAIPRKGRLYETISNQLQVSDFHTVTAKSRRDRNYQRDLAPLFEESDLVPRLTSIYSAELRRFLSGQWIDPTHFSGRVVPNDMHT